MSEGRGSEADGFDEIDPDLLSLFGGDNAMQSLDDLTPIPRDMRSVEGAPSFESMSLMELAELSRVAGPFRNQAVLEISERAEFNDSAALIARDLALQSELREDRLTHWSSMTWAVISSLLAANTPVSRKCAYEVFYALDSAERADVLFWLKAATIEQAQISKP